MTQILSLLKTRTRRLMRVACLLLGFGVAAPAVQADVLFAISEGASGAGTAATDRQMAVKYKVLVEVMERVLEQPVRVKYVRDFAVLEAGMKDQRFDLVLARPADTLARGVRDHGYRAVSTRKVGVKCTLVVPQDARWSSLADLGDLSDIRLILPEEASYMASFCAAELREHGLTVNPARTYYVREQDAIPFSLQKKLAQVGGVGSGSNIFRKLEAEGLRILHTSGERPFFPLIAGPRIDNAQVEQLRAGLQALAASPEGGAELASFGLRNFDTNPQRSLLDMLEWLEAPVTQ